MAKHVLIVFTDGFEEVEAITTVDLLRRAGIQVTVAGLENMQVRGSHEIGVITDTTLAQIRDGFDGLVLPGGPGTKNLANSEAVVQMVRDFFSRGLLCAAICAAPSVFDKAGILEGKNFTCFPGVEVEAGEPRQETVVRDGNMLTSRGVGTAIPFALAIIDYLLGSEKADVIARQIVYEGPR